MRAVRHHGPGDLQYRNNPPFAQLLERTGLPFRAYDAFGPEEQAERQELYIRMAEWVWNPSRLDLEGERPPVHEPLRRRAIDAAGTPDEAGEGESARHQERRAFWTALLSHAQTKTDLHARCSPTGDAWVSAGAGRTGLGFYYVLNQHQTRVELYINTGSREVNKALFDGLAEHRADIDEAFGGSLDWQRLDEKKTCRICVTLLHGGWGDRSTWARVVPRTVDATVQLAASLRPHLDRIFAR